jgi:cobalt-zinc-cadmium efflux system protein
MHPTTPHLQGMGAFAVIGMVVNGYAAWRLARGGTLNERVVSWHMIEDVLGWATVLAGSIVMSFGDWPIVDPVLSLISSAFILYGVLRNLHRTLRLFLQATPEGIDLSALRREIEELADVRSTHDAHLWSLDGQSHVLTLHVVVDDNKSLGELEDLKGRIRHLVARKGQIHVTMEMESAALACPAVDCVRD